MNDASAVLPVILILSVIHAGNSPAAISAAPTDPEQAVATIEQRMEQTPAPWSQDWHRRYVDTIRQAIGTAPNSVPAPWHVEALARGFEPYWQALAKGQDRPAFDVQRAEIRWYVENLVGLPPPSEPARRQLHDQYAALWAHAADSLLAQFPFLDPNAVQTANAYHLARCHRNIDAPLNPTSRPSASGTRPKGAIAALPCLVRRETPGAPIPWSTALNRIPQFPFRRPPGDRLQGRRSHPRR